MEFPLIVDIGPCGWSLRRTCLYISVFNLVIILLGGIVTPHNFSLIEVLGCFVFLLFGNILLLFGAIGNIRWLVIEWLIQGLFYVITWPYLFANVPINFNPLPSEIATVFAQLAMLIFFLVSTFYVYCYERQLKKQFNKTLLTVKV